MISYLSGTLIHKSNPTIILDVNGVGYEVDLTLSHFYQLPEVGHQAQVFTHLVVREDAHLLFGFSDFEHRDLFRKLIKVNGIGARTALSILSTLSAEDLALAVQNKDTTLLVRVPGIGKKTAERLILELSGKLAAVDQVQGSSSINEINQGLQALGYNEKEILLAIKNMDKNIDPAQGIRQALQFLNSK